jgi:deazaflavin-dependent oxidoreductase (nitroreductase family)
MSRLSSFRWLLSKVAAPLDVRLKNTPFAPSKMGVDFPLCYLTTTGRHTGKARTVPLFYVTVDGEPVVVATNFGRPLHPSWSYNLDAHKYASLEIDGDTTEVIADRLSESESLSVWKQLIQIWPAYAQYREIAPRDVRVYVLKPA